MRVFTTFILFAALFSLFAVDKGYAQSIDSRGTDFWLGFMPNFHNNIGDVDFPEEALWAEDSLYIFIAATEPTKGKIEYYDQFGSLNVKNFSITDPREVYIFSLQFYNYEVRGYNRSGTIVTAHNEGKKSRLSFHVTSDKDISVYGHSQANTTSEAFLVIPTDALGKDHFALAYYSDGTYTGAGMGDHRTPSQYLIVATEDQTRIKIAPSARTHSHGTAPYEIVLDKGDTYLEQAYIDDANPSLDLTGTSIKADKPIAVFGGHQRCRVPLSFQNSRDCLIEQMPPVSAWGSNAILVPFVKPIDDVSRVEDRYRVLAAYDSTIVNLPSNETVRLEAGKFLERDLSTTVGGFVTATKPILVAQYKRTSFGASGATNGDPLMMIIPPVEQFNDFYRVINVQAHEGGEEVYRYQYITVVGKKNVKGKLKIDGVVLPDMFFELTPDGEYVFASKAVSDGAHTVEADGERFGIYVYGYGRANSYGYYGGMNLLKLDPFPPQLQASFDCFEASGVLSDSSSGDSGLDTFNISQGPEGNTQIDITSKDTNVVRFTARLLDIYQDGDFVVEARDRTSRETKRTLEIPGFTFSTTGTKVFKEIDYVDTLMIGESVCLEIPITNYGKHKQTLTRMGVRSGWPDATFEGLPLTLGPGESGIIRYCFTSKSSAHYIDTIRFGNDCAMRDFATVDYLFARDSVPPQSLVVDDPCLNNVKFYFTEGFKFDKGLRDLDVQAENMNYKIDTTSLRFLEISCGIIDPYKDASMQITVTDSAGNKTVQTKEFPGFTLSFSSTDGTGKDFGKHKIGGYTCDSIMVTNTGKYKITIPDIYVFGNTAFSLPQSQMPFVIGPGETRPLEVCYLPRNSYVERDRDSLRITFNCIDRILKVTGDPEPITYVVPGICNLEVEASTGEYGERDLTFSVSALPSGEAFHGVIAGPGGNFNLEIYSSDGTLVKSAELGKLPAGKVAFDTPSDQLSSGVYFVRLVADGRSIVRNVMLNK